MKKEAAFGRPPTLSDARSVGGGASAGCRQWRLRRGYGSAALSGQRRRCICGAQAAAHRRWRGVGGAFRRAGGRTGAMHLITTAMAAALRGGRRRRWQRKGWRAGGFDRTRGGGVDATTSQRTRGKWEESYPRRFPPGIRQP
jgi:hypothetical protein